MADPRDAALHVVALQLAAACAQTLADAGRPVAEYGVVPFDPPAPSNAACSQLTCHIAGVTLSGRPDRPPGDRGQDARAGGASLQHTVLVVRVMRCVPTDTNGSLAVMAQATAALNADARRLLAFMVAGHRDETLFEGCAQVTFDGVIPVPLLGGVAGYSLPVHLVIDGYRPV